MGPKSGQKSKETYKLNEGGNQITLTINISTNDGYHPNMIRYLERVNDSTALAPSQSIVSRNEVIPSKKIADASCGWDLFEFWYFHPPVFKRNDKKF